MDSMLMPYHRWTFRHALAALIFSGFVLLAAGPGRGQSMPPQGGGPDPFRTPDFSRRVLESGGPRYADPSGQQLVVDVQIEGNRRVPTHQVVRHVKTRKNRAFDPEVVQADVRRLISSGRFHPVRTRTRQVEGGIVVIFEVTERPTVEYLRFIGNRAIGERALNRQSGIAVGDPLNQYVVEEGRRKIEDYYRSRGFADIQVVILEGTEPAHRGVVYDISEGHLHRVSKVEFIGNDPSIVTDGRLRTLIQSKPGILWYFFRGKVEHDKIKEDKNQLRAYYRSLGFFQARVGCEKIYDDSGKWLTLRFIIDEGPRYRVRNLTIEGNSTFETQQLQDQLDLQSGDYFHLTKMNRDVNTLRDLYGSNGYVYADVRAEPRFLEDTADGQLDLVYNVDEGRQFRVGEIRVHIKGEFPHTRHSVVLNRLSFRSGDIVDIRQIRNSERRLKASQLFEINPAEGDVPQIIIRPPDLDAFDNALANDAPPAVIRGQNEDGLMDLDVFLPRMRNVP
jgi:outer membrane protein insertion porin family